ncbi:hypothetical protein GCM10023215_27480 [Pseudonocardia yuanmonensis]|uniref:Uncharacterized protein n=1 Tax=Pseudonocardia yuanmonensis TaxID=1095914 RepID=A0ABP8WIJ9_9PSEU
MTAPSPRPTRAERRPGHPDVDQAELAYRIGCDAAALRQECTYADAPDPICHELLPWLTAVQRSLTGPALPLDALRELADRWRERRTAYFADDDWAAVRVVAPLERPPPSVWWRLRHGREPVPPRVG